MKRIYPAIVMLFLPLIITQLSGCAGGLPTNLVSLTTMAFTGKGLGEHALSATTGHDCAFINLVQEADLCEGVNQVSMSLMVTTMNVQKDYLIITPEQFLAQEFNGNDEQLIAQVSDQLTTKLD